MLDLLHKSGRSKGVIHVGANSGDEISAYRNLGMKWIAFFEPQPRPFRKLCGKLAQNEVAFNCAISTSNGFKEMFLASNSGHSSSFYRPKKHLVQYPHVRFERNAMFPVRRLSDVPLDFDKFDLLVIDVQGAELDVLRGAEAVLSSIETLICEVSRDELYEDAVLFDDLQAWLNTVGFDCREICWRTRTWGDALFKRVRESDGCKAMSRDYFSCREEIESLIRQTDDAEAPPAMVFGRDNAENRDRGADISPELERVSWVAALCDGDIIFLNSHASSLDTLWANVLDPRKIRFASIEDHRSCFRLDFASPAAEGYTASFQPLDAAILSGCDELGVNAGIFIINCENRRDDVLQETSMALKHLQNSPARKAIIWRHYDPHAEGNGSSAVNCLQRMLPIFREESSRLAFAIF